MNFFAFLVLVVRNLRIQTRAGVARSSPSVAVRMHDIARISIKISASTNTTWRAENIFDIVHIVSEVCSPAPLCHGRF